MNRNIGISIIVVIVIVAVIVFATKQDANAPAPDPVATSTPIVATSTPIATSTPQAKSYDLAEVSAHASAASCWAVVNGKVYDLTSWIKNHPGGQQAILNTCGKDGSAAFNNQHGGQTNPAKILQSFYIGELKQ